MQLLHIGDEENLVCLLWISDIRTFMACLYIYCFANHMAVWPILVHLHCVVYRYAICVSVCFMDERWSVNYYLFVIMIATFFMILRIFHFYDHLQVFLSSLGWYFALRSLQRCLQIACLHSCCWLPLFFQVDGSDWTSHRHHTFGRSSSLRPPAATATAASPSHILKLLIKWLLFMTLLVVLMLDWLGCICSILCSGRRSGKLIVTLVRAFWRLGIRTSCGSARLYFFVVCRLIFWMEDTAVGFWCFARFITLFMFCNLASRLWSVNSHQLIYGMQQWCL